MGCYGCAECDPKGCRGRAESPLLASTRDNFAARNSPWWGLTRRLRRGRRACSPMGRSITSGGEPKVSKGERREARAQWAQPPKAVSAPEFRQTTSGAHGSAGRADCLPRGKPPACMTRDNSAARNSLLIGPDAPTPAREKGLQPYGALTLFFRWRKKSVQKKASGTATTGKSPLLPILTAGLAMSRAAWLARFRMLSCALGARLFPPPKWAGLFPSAAYRRSAPAQSAVGRLIPCGASASIAADGKWAYPLRVG